MDKLRAQAYKEKIDTQEEIKKIKAKQMKPCQECNELRHNLEEMSQQMEKIEEKVATKCQKIESKMQKKIDMYKE